MAISPCVYLNVPDNTPDPRRRVFGNALEGNALDIWHCGEFADFRAALTGNRPDAACLACPKRFEIVGGR
ncbi:MAG: SPASM domain-containing protein [Desulfovibrionaceae bacterium]|nr:SPASM domain-containing protein [Desulfovibrionaceae bacterium]